MKKIIILLLFIICTLFNLLTEEKIYLRLNRISRLDLKTSIYYDNKNRPTKSTRLYWGW